MYLVKKILIVFLLCCAVKSYAQQPNIIFVFADDLAYNALGIYGNDQVKTPNIDQLGERGLVFNRHYNTTAICMASRANVMSGMLEYKTGCNFMHGPMGTEQWKTSYPILLKEAGYTVGFAGKFGFTVSDEKNKDIRGTDGYYAAKFFDDYKGGRVQTSYNTAKNKPMVKYAAKYPHSTRSYGAATIDFMKDAVNKDKPFCMSIYFKAPHSPLDPDPMFDDVYENTFWKKPANFGPVSGAHLAEQSKTGRQYKQYFKKYFNTEDKYQEYMRKYNQLIYGVDYTIGMIMDALSELNINDNTIIIFSSDNGSSLGAHGLGGKALPYEEASKAPLIIFDPRNTAARNNVSESVTGNIDITATILDAAGLEVPNNYDGISLMPIVNNPNKEVRKSLPLIQVFGEESSRSMSVITKDYKYVYWFYEDRQKGLTPTEELYHISDSHEMTNLSENIEYKSTLSKMRKIYDAQVIDWKEQSVDYNGYQEYGTLFDRSVTWQKKKYLIVEKDDKVLTADEIKKQDNKKKK